MVLSWSLGLIQPALDLVEKEFFVGCASFFKSRLAIELGFDELDLGKGDALGGRQIVIVVGHAEQAVGVLTLQILALRGWAAGVITCEDAQAECVHDLTEW